MPFTSPENTFAPLLLNITLPSPTKDKDLLIGMTPRGATEVIVRTANKYKIPFSILMCPNIKKSSKYDEELDALLELINSTKNDSYHVGVSYLDKNCYYPYPIVYKK